MARVGVIAVWVAALSGVGALGVLGYELTRGPEAVPQSMDIERLPRRQNHHPWSRWSVTEHLSAHFVLIAHVETEFLHEARSIARQIAEPVKARYAEVLIYFHRPGRPDTPAPRRVQWTLKTGYVETVYD